MLNLNPGVDYMEKLVFETEKQYGKFKILNATNGGPWHKRHADDQYRSNFDNYKKARIPYSRNHDSAMCSIYGGPYSHDITCIFPNFDADPYSPDSYDFACTDEAILVCLEAGTETFFRLGQTIEHHIKKHGTIPPNDFKKWAVICEHIIKHYNYGWAQGFNLGIEYWEIWNEPDLDDDNSPNKRCWGGTKEEFFNFYEIAAKHLKNCFPTLKIGGPALAWREDWADDFLKRANINSIPLDFFSWHIYSDDPKPIIDRAQRIKNLLIKYGFTKTESILNEWNYVKGWGEEFVYTIECINSMKGAAFMMAVISEAQKSDIDMLMYYDTRPSVFNGVFDFYTYRPLKGYYPFYWYGNFYDLEYEIRCNNRIDNIYSIAGVDKYGKITAIITYYSDYDNAADKEIAIDFGRESTFDIYLLDSTNNGELLKTSKELSFLLQNHSVIMIREK